MMSCEFEMNKDIWQIIDKCQNPQKAGGVIAWLMERCQSDGILFTDYQWQSLSNHVAAMVDRSITGEVLDIDPELFTEVGEDSLILSREVAERIGGIADGEIFLLSVHFEGAKENSK